MTTALCTQELSVLLPMGWGKGSTNATLKTIPPENFQWLAFAVGSSKRYWATSAHWREHPGGCPWLMPGRVLGRPSSSNAIPGARSLTMSWGGCPQACICTHSEAWLPSSLDSYNALKPGHMTKQTALPAVERQIILQSFQGHSHIFVRSSGYACAALHTGPSPLDWWHLCIHKIWSKLQNLNQKL